MQEGSVHFEIGGKLLHRVNFPVIRTMGRANHNNLHDGGQRVSHLALHSEPRLSQENLQDQEYRQKYAANLKRELPRIPYAPDFWTYSQAGKQLAELHIHYEQQPEFPLTRIYAPNQPHHWEVKKMRLNKERMAIFYNDWLTLNGIPPEFFEYRLGNRSALEWVIEQYQVKTDTRSGIVNDPNDYDNLQVIIKLIGQVIQVSLETVKMVKGLPALT